MLYYQRWALAGRVSPCAPISYPVVMEVPGFGLATTVGCNCQQRVAHNPFPWIFITWCAWKPVTYRIGYGAI